MEKNNCISKRDTCIVTSMCKCNLVNEDTHKIVTVPLVLKNRAPISNLLKSHLPFNYPYGHSWWILRSWWTVKVKTSEIKFKIEPKRFSVPQMPSVNRYVHKPVSAHTITRFFPIIFKMFLTTQYFFLYSTSHWWAITVLLHATLIVTNFWLQPWVQLKSRSHTLLDKSDILDYKP